MTTDRIKKPKASNGICPFFYCVKYCDVLNVLCVLRSSENVRKKLSPSPWRMGGRLPASGVEHITPALVSEAVASVSWKKQE